MPTEDVAALRERLAAAGLPVDNIPDDHIRELMHQRALDFRDKAPTTAAQAATIILDGVREGRWRILVGEDADALDEMVRIAPRKFMSLLSSAFENGWAFRWTDSVYRRCGQVVGVTVELDVAIVGVYEYPDRDVDGELNPLQIKAACAARAPADAGLNRSDVDVIYDAFEGVPEQLMISGISALIRR